MGEVGTVETNGGTLEFETAGDGRAVVLLHPGLWDRRTWDREFQTYAERFRVIRYDARGYGRSSRPEPGQPYSHVDDLAAVMDASQVASAALVGCSMGGATAVEFAVVRPDRVDALVLVAPGLNGDLELEPEEDTEFERLEAPVEAAMEAGDRTAAREAQLAIWAPLGVDDRAGRRIREIAFDNLHELTMDESGRQDLDPPILGRLGDVTAPTLVLPADHDPLAYRRVARLYADGIANARLVEIPETDHVLNVRRPEAFDAVVLPFLEEVLG